MKLQKFSFAATASFSITAQYIAWIAHFKTKSLGLQKSGYDESLENSGRAWKKLEINAGGFAAKSSHRFWSSTTGAANKLFQFCRCLSCSTANQHNKCTACSRTSPQPHCTAYNRPPHLHGRTPQTPLYWEDGSKWLKSAVCVGCGRMPHLFFRLHYDRKTAITSFDGTFIWVNN